MRFDLSWMMGRFFADVAYLEPASWRFLFDDGIQIRADCPWRVVRSGRIALSSEDHGQQYGLPAPINAEAECRSMLRGLKVEFGEIREDTRDIVICFEAGARLEIVPLSSGYESWELTGPGGIQTIAQGGGNLVTWS